MIAFLKRYWAEMTVAAFLTLMIPIGWSLTANRQVSYAPCLVKVLSTLKADPSASKVVSVDGLPVTPDADPCSGAADVARDTNRAIGDLLMADRTLFARLPTLLKSAGMSCKTDQVSITCDCRKSGPFVIANPSAYCTPLVNLPLPFVRALSLDVSIRPANFNGKTVRLGRYVVEMTYDSGFVDPGNGARPADTRRARNTLTAWAQERGH